MKGALFQFDDDGLILYTAASTDRDLHEIYKRLKEILRPEAFEAIMGRVGTREQKRDFRLIR